MSLRYKVPQNVQREDQILFFITMKQLVVLMVTGGISYMLYVRLNQVFILSQPAMVAITLPFLLGCAFCFIKIKGIGLFQFCLLMIEQLLSPNRRYWQPDSQVMVSSTTNFSIKGAEEEKVTKNKNISRDKIKNLAELIDSGGESSIKN